jgi:hypothetical protein
MKAFHPTERGCGSLLGFFLLGISFWVLGGGEPAGALAFATEQKADRSTSQGDVPLVPRSGEEPSSSGSGPISAPSPESASERSGEEKFPSASGGPALADPAAVEEVEAGRRQVAYAAWWGPRPEDATQALQSALRCKAKKIIVQKLPHPLDRR